MLRNTIPFPRWFVLSSTPVLLSLQHKRVHVLCCPLCYSLSSLCYLLPWSITIWYVKNVVRIAHVLRILDIVILLAITIHFLVPCCFKPEYQQVNSDVWFQYFWQPYCLEVNNWLFSFLVCWMLTHHFSIGCATQSVFPSAPFDQCLIVVVPSSIRHYTIWFDKCYLLDKIGRASCRERV